jgi:hypothetical protein
MRDISLAEEIAHRDSLRRRNKRIIALVASIIILIGVVGGYLLARNNKKDLEATDTAISPSTQISKPTNSHISSSSTIKTTPQTTNPIATPDYTALYQEYDAQYQAKLKAEQDKKNADNAFSVVIGLAFDSLKNGNKYSGASSADGTMTFSYIGNKLSASSSTEFGTTYLSYSYGDASITSVSNSKSGNYYCSDTGGWLSSCSSGMDIKSVSLFDSSPYNAQNTIKYVMMVDGIFFHPYTGAKIYSADSPSASFSIY